MHLGETVGRIVGVGDSVEELGLVVQCGWRTDIGKVDRADIEALRDLVIGDDWIENAVADVYAGEESRQRRLGELRAVDSVIDRYRGIDDFHDMVFTGSG